MPLREVDWTSPNGTTRIPPPDDDNLEVLSGEHIRIVAVLDHVIKPYDELKLVYFQ